MIYKFYIKSEPNPKLSLYLPKILNVYKLNLHDFEYIYNALYHIIDEFEEIPGFIEHRDIISRNSKR